MTTERQPLLHDLVTCLAAPVVILSTVGGDIEPGLETCCAQGVFAADIRVLSRCAVTIDGARPEHIATSCPATTAAEAEFVGLVRSLGKPGADPTVWLRRSRAAQPTGCREQLTVVNVSDEPISAELRLELETDLLPIEQVKSGGIAPSQPMTVSGGLIRSTVGAVGLRIQGVGGQLSAGPSGAEICWQLTVPSRSEVRVHWQLEVNDPSPAVVPAPRGGFVAPRIDARDRRVAPLVDRSVADLRGLRLATRDRPDDVFLAAGSPWYLTLFGRDSLWAARMLLPLGTDLAYTTLCALAAYQGTTVDAGSAEEPGKIPHEIRRGVFTHDDISLPPVYFGTVDATPLWICLLVDAWRWGLSEPQLQTLLPALDRALTWLRHHGDQDSDGFLEYIDQSGHGLANQGWKDSGDSIRFRDGRIAVGPIALAEVQGYAYEAAVKAADLLEARGMSGAAEWRSYASDLASAFRSKFWVHDDLGRYPAIALDGQKVPVDAPASNMGHLLATGILDVEESATVALRLVHPSMSSGFGLRTMSTTAGGYSPLSYHCGSVWPHDTAIAVHGLGISGHGPAAMRLAAELLAAGAAFSNRLPELYAGFAADELGTPVPYPASCRPQAWSAASAITIVQAMLGLSVDVPAGVIRLDPPAEAGALRVRGFRVAGAELDISVSDDGRCTVLGLPAGLHVETGPRTVADGGSLTVMH